MTIAWKQTVLVLVVYLPPKVLTMTSSTRGLGSNIRIHLAAKHNIGRVYGLKILAGNVNIDDISLLRKNSTCKYLFEYGESVPFGETKEADLLVLSINLH